MASAYWSRTITFTNSGTYHFTGWIEDGARIFIDEQEVFRQNTYSTLFAFDFQYPLSSGKHVIQIHYYDLTGTARMEFYWEGVPPPPTPVL